jgi:hypothetical protein
MGSPIRNQPDGWRSGSEVGFVAVLNGQHDHLGQFIGMQGPDAFTDRIEEVTAALDQQKGLPFVAKDPFPDVQRPHAGNDVCARGQSF